MTGEKVDTAYDLNRILVRPLYFGLTVNILVPVGGLFVCYYVQNNVGRGNMVGDAANTVFAVFAAFALAQAVFAFWWHRRRLAGRLVTALNTLEDELVDILLARVRPVFLVIAAISLYGFVYYYLTGRFTETVVFVLVSFIVFQVVRPRHGYLRRLIARQEALLKSPVTD